MTGYTTIDGDCLQLIPLQVKPQSHQEVPSITGSAISPEAGTVLYGFYSMDYKLPGGDCLRLLANHNHKTVQILLITHDPNKLNRLPGERASSLVANTIANINRYCIRSESYSKPRTKAQLAKFELANKSIGLLSKLLPFERSLKKNDWFEQEELREKVIAIIEQCRNENRLLTIDPVVSEGELGTILYETRQAAQNYEFNRVFAVSRIDQHDFRQVKQLSQNPATSFVWDSEIHIGYQEEAINNAIRVICQEYNILPAKSLNDIPANRFKRLHIFLHKLWQDGKDWINHLSETPNPTHKIVNDTRNDGLTISKIKPYYRLQGIPQKKYASLQEMANQMTGTDHLGMEADSPISAKQMLRIKANGNWIKITGSDELIIRLENDMLSLHYFEENGCFYPLPHGQDLFTLSQLSKQHLYLPEKLNLQLRAFFSKIPQLFKTSYQSLKHYVKHNLYDDFTAHLHQGHPQENPQTGNGKHKDYKVYRKTLEQVLRGQGLLNDGQSLEEFVAQQLANSSYVIVRAEHPPSPPAYENPLHRSLHVLRHIGGFFVDTSEKNPIIGTLAMAAYLYGGSAVVAPTALTSILNKLHLHSLIAGIKPVQALGQWMSHGTMSEAISAAVTLWQGVILTGDLDQFFIKAISVLQDDPAEVAIVVALAIALGYGLCKTFPSLQEEMGEFPYVNYAALGAKGGAAIYDTVMHPGDDWFLGTIKWLLKGGLTLLKIVINPFIEAYHYGYTQGFLSGLKKSGLLIVQASKQILASLVDFVLVVATIPLLEISAMLFFVPFRGLTSFASKLYSYLGNWQSTGELLLEFALRPGGWNYMSGFRISPLYGFSSPFAAYSSNLFLNIVCNACMLFLWPSFQLVKNLVMLPALDLFTFVLRLSLTILNPVTRGGAYMLGSFLSKAGYLWDNSLGYVFRAGSWLIIQSSNFLIDQAAGIKQSLLGLIQACRKGLFHWAYEEEDSKLHTLQTDQGYFLEKPFRLEQLPHDRDCLLDKLLNKMDTGQEMEDEVDHHQPLFANNSISQSSMEQNYSPLQI